MKRKTHNVMGLVLLLGGAGCPAPTPAALKPTLVQSADTQVVVRVEPFAFDVLEAGATTAVGQSYRGGETCAPLVVALRPADDVGRFHRPETPAADLNWLTSRNAERQADGSFRVELVDREDELLGHADLRVFASREGFVALDVEWPFTEGEIAMAGTCVTLSAGAHVVGGGERFDGVDLVGRTIPLAFTLPGPYASGTNEAHVPIPFLSTTDGLGLLVESERVGAFDVGNTQSSAIQIRFHGNRLPLRLRAGSIVENAAGHARYMGLPKPPPDWIFAPMQWRNELALTVENGVVQSDGRDRIVEDAQRLRQLDIPTTTLWIDAPWSTGYNTFSFNEVQFPEPDTMIAELEAMGFRVIVWATEHLNESDDSNQQFGMPPFGSRALFEQYAAAGWLVQNGDGTGPFVFPWGRGSGGYVDFTNPAAASAWQAQMTPLLQRGVRGFKLDYGETMRADLLGISANDAVRFHDDSTAATMHTRYARLYHEAFLGALREVHPNDHFVITRTGGIYDQQNGVVIWPGDLDNNFARAGDVQGDGLAIGGLPAAISGGLSLALSGYPLYGSDIGGYVGGPPTGEVLLRWAQYAALTPVMQLGGGGTGDSTHNPWDPRYGENATEIYRRYARLHMDLSPMWSAWVAASCTDGTPFMLPLGVYAADDDEAWEDPDAFVLGERLAVYPVVEADADERTLRLPPGVWLDYFTGTPWRGSETHTVPAPLDTMPLFQRAGSILVLSDPRLMTAVATDAADVADVEQYGSLRVIKTSAGPADAVTVQGITVEQATAGEGMRVDIQADTARAFLIDLALQPEIGPRTDAELDVGGETPGEVADETELLACSRTCVLREPKRVRVLVRGDQLRVVFSPAERP